MTDQLTIQCGSADHRGVRVVIASIGDLVHRGKFDVDRQDMRRKFREKVCRKFGLGEDAHESIETQVIQAADNEDVCSGSLWEPVTTTLSQVASSTAEYLWPGRIPLRMLTTVDGDGGVGKGLAMMAIAARGSRGDSMPPVSAPDGTFEPWSTLFITGEDSPEFVLRPRLDAAGGDPGRIITMSSVEIPESDRRTIALLEDISLIERVVENNEVKLVVIDPYSEFIDPHLNMNSDPDNRKCLGPLAEMAQRTGAAVVMVRHLNKKEGQSAQYRGSGSTAPLNASRAAFIVAPDPEDPDLRVLACTKFNIGPKPVSLRFRIEPAGTTARVRWEGECELTAGDLVKTHSKCEGSKVGQL